MNTFAPKTYQSQVLESIEIYFQTCHELPSPSIAFTATTKRLWGRGLPYHPLPGFPADMPYFCLRVPTGGGKTWLAAKSVHLVNTHLSRGEHSVILWLVPSKPIREQTLRALRNRRHPYHAALREAGPITVLDLDDAKSVTRATLDTSTTIIVATRQAFQVEDEECRKVYQSSGALMHHFEHLAPVQRDELLKEGQGADQTIPHSLANVLRLRRPFVIVDEAHNSRTELTFDMLARFRPSGVLELTATPDLERTPSNVLHSVSAAELKAEEMIKLPVVLHPQVYAPSRDYDGRFGFFDFRKHYYGRIGDFDSKEEFECACWLDTQAQKERIRFWVRNLVRREGSAFFLQKADGRFYPDFLCQLPDSSVPGAILAVEYKGADRWVAAENDRLIGGLWAELSEGRCRFVMVKEKRWDWIEEQLR